MGLVAFGSNLIQGALRGLGLAAPLATGAGGGAAAGGLLAAARTLAPSLIAGAAGAALPSLFGFGGGAAAAPVAAPGAARQMVQLGDGSMVLVSRQGIPIRAQLFLPAGAKLPAGATVVSVSPGATLFGIRKRRARKTFQGEITRCKTVISDAKSLVKAVQKK